MIRARDEKGRFIKAIDDKEAERRHLLRAHYGAHDINQEYDHHGNFVPSYSLCKKEDLKWLA